METKEMSPLLIRVVEAVDGYMSATGKSFIEDDYMKFKELAAVARRIRTVIEKQGGVEPDSELAIACDYLANNGLDLEQPYNDRRDYIRHGDDDYHPGRGFSTL